MPYDYEAAYVQIVKDVCLAERPKYDNLVAFVSNLLSNKVEYWCKDNKLFKGGFSHEDVMQEIQIRIIKKCELYFFKPVDGKTERTCNEFKAWCYTVARNRFLTILDKEKKNSFNELNLSLKIDDVSANEYNPENSFVISEDSEEDKMDVNRCVEIVFDLKSQPHIILAWLSVTLFEIVGNFTQIESIHLVDRAFSNMDLYRMFDYVSGNIILFDWINISKEQIEMQRNKLNRIDKETGMIIGSMKYSDFYMNKGAEMSMSDWIYRINFRIKKKW